MTTYGIKAKRAKAVHRHWSEELEKDVLSPDTIDVYESEDAEPTGIIDKDGNDIVRVKDSIGFIRK